nr:MAG TPA: hypothetical protein [Caudoviricetes sp.]
MEKKQTKRAYCTCEAKCIHHNGIVATIIEGARLKFNGCGNTSKKCNCKYRRIEK